MGIGLNSLSYAGFVFLKAEEQFNYLLQEAGGPATVLAMLGFPANDKEAEVAAQRDDLESANK